MRYTEKYAEAWFRRLAEGLGKDIVGDAITREIGAWEFDYNAFYGGAIVLEIHNESWGVTRPLTDYRLKPWEFGVMCQAVLNSRKI